MFTLRLTGMIVILGLLLTAGPETRAGEPKSARALNDEGMTAYGQKDFPQAAQKFRAAIKVDPAHKLANYNLACVMALLVEHSSNCDEAEGAIYDLAQQLKRAAQLDPRVLRKGWADKDLAQVRKYPAVQLALGADLSKKAVVEDILKGVRVWYGPKMGVFDGFTLTFYKKGGFRLYLPQMGGEVQEVDRPGRFRVEGQGKIHLEFKDGQREILNFKSSGYIQFGKENYSAFKDCSA